MDPEKIRKGDVSVSKVPGASNPADAGTKYIDRSSLAKHMSFMNVFPEGGRAESAPMLVHKQEEEKAEDAGKKASAARDEGRQNEKKRALDKEKNPQAAERPRTNCPPPRRTACTGGTGAVGATLCAFARARSLEAGEKPKEKRSTFAANHDAALSQGGVTKRVLLGAHTLGVCLRPAMGRPGQARPWEGHGHREVHVAHQVRQRNVDGN